MTLLCLAAGVAAFYLGREVESPKLSPPIIAELQGSTAILRGQTRPATPRESALVWVLGQSLNEACFQLVPLSPRSQSGNPSAPCLPIEAVVNDSLALVDVASADPDVPTALSVTTPGGRAVSPAFNAPELHWVDPYARVSDTVAVTGRRFVDPAQVTLDCATPAPSHLPAAARLAHRRNARSILVLAVHVESDTRATFILPGNVASGVCTVTYVDAWGRWAGATSGGPAAATVLTVLPPLPSPRASVIDASKPPYNADSTGATSATAAILSAINAVSNGGTVTLDRGTYLINPLPNASGPCRTMAAALCIPDFGKRVTLAGALGTAGRDEVTLLQGNQAGVAIWGSALSLADLTLSDVLPPGQRVNISNGTYSSPSLWSMDTWSAWRFNVSDVTFRNVHFVATRAAKAVHLRYCRRCTVRDSLFEGGSIYLGGPLRDVRIVNNTARLEGPFPQQLGGGVAGFVMNGVGGRISSVLIANNTIGALYPQAQSTISGRIFQAQGFFEQLYIVGNLNLQAGPGAKGPDMNQGEQFLWETGAEGRIADDTNGTVLRVNGSRLTVTFGSPATLSYLLAKIRPAGSLPPAIDGSGGMLARGWDPEYGDTYGGVTILAGPGVGQSRMLLGLLEDNQTLLLDRPWGVEPTADSCIVVFSQTVHAAVIRDNVMIGVPQHVEQDSHTATVMIPLWGRAHRTTYANNVGRDIRVTMYAMVSVKTTSTTINGLSVTDQIISGVTSDHTRVGLDIEPQPHSGLLSMIVTMRNITLRNVVHAAVAISTTCTDAIPCSGPLAGGLAIDGISVANSTIGIATYPPGSNPEAPWRKPVNFSWAGSGIGALLVRRARFVGPGQVGAQLTEMVPEARFSNVNFTGFAVAVNGTKLCPTAFVLTPLALATSRSTWVVFFENSGPVSGNFSLTHLDPGLRPNASQWHLRAGSGPIALEIALSSELVDGVLACGEIAASQQCGPQITSTFCLQ